MRRGALVVAVVLGGSLALAGTRAACAQPELDDPSLGVTLVADGVTYPTSMALSTCRASRRSPHR